MALEFLGAVIILAAWIAEMHKKLTKNQTYENRYKFLMAYFIGFALLTTYAVDINNMLFAFFFALLALLTLLEFAFVMIKITK